MGEIREQNDPTLISQSAVRGLTRTPDSPRGLEGEKSCLTTSLYKPQKNSSNLPSSNSVDEKPKPVFLASASLRLARTCMVCYMCVRSKQSSNHCHWKQVRRIVSRDSLVQTPSSGLWHPSFNHCRIITYAIGSRKLSAGNEQFFADAQTVVSLLQTTQMLLLSWCLMSSDVIWHIRDKLWPMPKHGSIRKVYACLAVTCHLHFWQNDRDFLRATVVTRGWNGYRNKSQHRKSTLEKKILPPFQQGFEPATFQSRVRCSNHWAIPAPTTQMKQGVSFIAANKVYTGTNKNHNRLNRDGTLFFLSASVDSCAEIKSAPSVA